MPVFVELDETGDHIVINAEWRLKELCKSIPGASWSAKEQIWRIPVSWSGCLALRSTFKAELQIGPKLSAWAANERAVRVDPSNLLRDVDMMEEGDQDLFPHQRAGVEFLSTARQALLADQPGLGKTAQTIRALKRLHDRGEQVFPILVVCPNTIKKNWQREFDKWWPGVNVTVINGSATQRRAQFDQQSDVIVVNWESLRSHSRLAPYGSIALARCIDCGGHDSRITPNRCEVHERDLNLIDFKAVVADECFTGDVLIDTPSGKKRIDSIKSGDVVWGFDHNTKTVVPAIVSATMTRKSCSIIEGWNGTPNHPFYVADSGYVPLGDLTEKDVLYAINESSVSGVWPSIRRVLFQEQGKNVLFEDMLGSGEREEVLVKDYATSEGAGSGSPLRAMPRTIYTAIQEEKSSEILLAEMFNTKSIESPWDEGKTVKDYDQTSIRFQQQLTEISFGESQFGKEPTETSNSGTAISEREAWLAKSSIWDEYQSQENFSRSLSSLEYAASGASSRVYGAVSGYEHLPEGSVLGYSIHGNEISGGSRWGGASQSEKDSCRCSAHAEAHVAGVDSHPILELRSYERYERMCEEGARYLSGNEVDVYSITTSTGNYFANEVLVRNCHRSKDPKSKQTRALWSATGDADIRFALTGTPIAKDVVDLWPILHWISPAEWPSRTKWIDRMIDTMLNAFGGMMVLGVKPHMEQEFYAAINPRMRRMLKAKVLPWLPEVITDRRDVEMGAKQAKAYKQMLEHMIVALETESGATGDVVVAANPLTQALRLLQFASSYAEITIDPASGQEKVVLSDPSCKVDALMDDMKNGDFGEDSVAVCAVSRQLIEILSARLTKEGIAHGLITGAIDADERQRHIDDFQAGRTKWILFTAQAGGVGVTLTTARRLVMLQRPWSLVDYQQALDRVHRIGSEIHESVLITDYVTEGTIEERVIQALDTKADNFEQIVRDKDQLLKILKEATGKTK